jgi:hypothetical protein
VIRYLPYTETHTITIGPITLAAGIRVTVGQVQEEDGLHDQVTIEGTTGTAKTDTVTLLHAAFAQLMTAASAEGVGAPVFQ